MALSSAVAVASPGCTALNATLPVTLTDTQAGPVIPSARFYPGDIVHFTVVVNAGSNPGFLQLNETGVGSPLPHNFGGTENETLFTGGIAGFQLVNGTPSQSGSNLTGSLTCTPTSDEFVLIEPDAMPTLEAGIFFSQQISASGTPGPYTFSIQAGSLPNGLTMNASGLISGTPTGTGFNQIRVEALDTSNNAFNSTWNYSFNVVPAVSASISVHTDVTCRGANNGILTAQANDGVGPYTYQWTPSGGTGATASGLAPNNYTVTITDANGKTATANATIAQPATALAFTGGAMTGGTFANAYSGSIPSATGGWSNYTYTQTAGSLPPGTSLSSAGLLTGTPTAAGPASFTVNAVDANGCSQQAGVSITIAPETINVTAQPLGKVFGSSDPPLTYTTSPALFGSDTFSGSLGRAPGENAGIYPINTGSLALSANYTLSFTGANFTISKADQTLTFAAPPTLAVNGTGSVSASNASPSSGNSITYSTTSTTYCSVTPGGLVTAIAAGSNVCVITATQAGSGNYNAGSATQTLSIGKADQTLTFAAPPTLAVNGTGSVSASNASPNSGNSITYSTTSTTYCSVTPAGLVTAIAAGSNVCVITATQAGSGNYNAGSATQPLSIGKADQTLTFDPPPALAVNGMGSVSASSATPNSGNSISYSTTSTTYCSVTSGGLVTASAAGSNVCVITATQAGDGNYNAGSATQTLSIDKAAQTLTFAPPPMITVGGTGNVSASSATPNSGNDITYSTTSSDCSVDASGLISGLVFGTDNCTITATQAGTNDYLAGTATLTLSIDKALSTVSLTSSTNPSVQGNWVTFVASVDAASPSAAHPTAKALTAAAPGGSVSFSDGATLLSTKTLTNGVASFSIAFTTPGDHSITAAYSGDATTAASSVTITQAVGAAFPTTPAPMLSVWLLSLLGVLVTVVAYLRRRVSG